MPEAPFFFTQDVVYIVDRPFNLPKLILEGLFGSSLWVCCLWSLHSACIQSSSCIIYECCGCYSDSLIEIVDTSSWNKNNEGTINLSAVNSHLREQHVRFLSPGSWWHQIHLHMWYVFLLDRSNGLASRPISQWISFHFKLQPSPHLLHLRHELRLIPQKVFFIFCQGPKSYVTELCFGGMNYWGWGPKQSNPIVWDGSE